MQNRLVSKLGAMWMLPEVLLERLLNFHGTTQDGPPWDSLFVASRTKAVQRIHSGPCRRQEFDLEKILEVTNSTPKIAKIPGKRYINLVDSM